MIIDRAFIREVGQTSVAVALVIVGIFAVVRLVRFLAKAAEGEIPVDTIFLLLSLKLVTYVDLILPLVLFAAVLMVMGRWVRDNEMTVLQACGVGLGRLLRPTLVLAAAVGTVVAVFSFYLTPLAIDYTHRIMEESKRRTELSGIVPGVFSDVRGSGVYYVERLGEREGELIDVFIYGRFLDNEDVEDVVVARKGHQYVDEQTGDRFLVLEKGTRYQGTPGQADYSILEFDRYALRITTQPKVKPSASVKAMPTAQLLRSNHPKAPSEWHWRLSKPIAVVILTVMALGFTYVGGARQGQFLRTVAAFMLYFIYANLLGYGHALLQKGRIDPSLGLWWVHVPFAIGAAYLLLRHTGRRALLRALRLRWE